MSLAERLERLLSKNQGPYTQEALAGIFRVSQPTIHGWLNGTYPRGQKMSEVLLELARLEAQHKIGTQKKKRKKSPADYLLTGEPEIAELPPVTINEEDFLAIRENDPAVLLDRIYKLETQLDRWKTRATIAEEKLSRISEITREQ